MKNGKGWLVLIVIAFLVLLGIYENQRPHEVKQTIPSTLYALDPAFEHQVVVSIEGELVPNLFGRDVFIGELRVNEGLKYDITLKEDHDGFFALLRSEDPQEIRIAGSITTSNKLDRIYLKLPELNARFGLNDADVAGPAHTSAEAQAIAGELAFGEGRQEASP
ncbi:hypothetical protein [uncultured Paenibacillus sp.]|uniref:hypothetical protein n=1 Tax=uncultured Paenibacillus sp. TaxID=227322 RepID=UPI0015AFC052|nr:hypothetical protein [uncultured Paenibacillus sp.]